MWVWSVLEMIRPRLVWWKPPLPKPSISTKHMRVLSTTNWHLARLLPATEQQQGCLSSASVENEPYGASSVDFNHPWGSSGCIEALCSRESGGTDLQRIRYFQELISWSQSLHLFISVWAGLSHLVVLCLWAFSRQEYQSGLPRPPPGDLPNPWIKPRSPALQADSLASEPSGKPFHI